MDTQTPIEMPISEFSAGSTVIYAMHGKCSILGKETRTLGGKPVEFYRLKLKKASPAKSQKQEAAIWVPIANAKDQGLRLPMTQEGAQEALKVLMSREYYFKLNEHWGIVQPLLEKAIRTEGGVGLAKVVSYLHVLKKRQFSSNPEINKLQETVNKLLFRELSDVLGEPVKALEDKVSRGMRSKTLLDT